MYTHSVFPLVFVAALFTLSPPAAHATRFVNLAPIIDGTWTDQANNLNDGVFETTDISGASLKVEAGPATVDVSRAFLEFDLTDIVNADRILAASLILTSAVANGDPFGPLTHVLCFPGKCQTDLADGFASEVLGTFPFINGTLSVDVTGFVRQEVAKSASSIGFLLMAHSRQERDWEQLQQFFRSNESGDENLRPRLALTLSTPEPGSILLMSSGLLLAVWLRRRKRGAGGRTA